MKIPQTSWKETIWKAKYILGKMFSSTRAGGHLNTAISYPDKITGIWSF